MKPHQPVLTIGKFPISICTAIALHGLWALGLLLDPTAVHATAPHALLIAFRNTSDVVVILIIVATLAFLGMLANNRLLRFGLIIWQQIVLWFSMFGILNAMLLGQFADGTVRTPWFLVVDQVAVVLITLGHTTALYLIARGYDDYRDT